MKNEKFCFSKGTGLIALVGIILVGAVFAMNYMTSNQQTTGTKAAFGCPNTLTYPVADTDSNFAKKCPFPMTNENGEVYKITVNGIPSIGGITAGTPSHKSTCCYVPGTFAGGTCPVNSAPRPFCLTQYTFPGGRTIGVNDETGVSVKNTKLGVTWPCCKTHIYNNANNLPTSVPPTAVPAATATPDPRRVSQTCTPDATQFLPADFGCNVCATSTKLAELKAKLFKTSPGLYGQFGSAANIPDYFAAGNTKGIRTCYAMFGLPKKTGAAGSVCITESCVNCVNKPVDAKYCVGTKIDCSPNKTKLQAIVTAYNAGKYEVARTGMNELFKLSNTQVKDPTKSACYMPGAAVKGTSVDDASFALQTVGYCGYLQLSVEQQEICSCATMTNLNNPTCKSAMTKISNMAR